MIRIVGVLGELYVVAAVTTDGLSSGIEPFFLGYGVLGAMFLLMLLGWLRPKWSFDQIVIENKTKDELIASLSVSVKTLSEQLARRRA